MTTTPPRAESCKDSSSIVLIVFAGGAADIRPIRAAMTQAYRAFVGALSAASRFNRFHVVGHAVDESLANRLTHVDQASHVALAAFDDARPGLMIAEARYVIDEQRRAEWAIAVADKWQRKGVGYALASILLSHAHNQHVVGLWGTVQRTNQPMKMMACRLGFTQRHYPRDGTLLLIERAL